MNTRAHDKASVPKAGPMPSGAKSQGPYLRCDDCQTSDRTRIRLRLEQPRNLYHILI